MDRAGIPNPRVLLEPTDSEPYEIGELRVARLPVASGNIVALAPKTAKP